MCVNYRFKIPFVDGGYDADTGPDTNEVVVSWLFI